MGKVYIVKGGELYKFGNSENPEERLKTLQTGSPVPLELIYTFDARTPKRAETYLKREFAAKHAHGEWFRLNEADILSVKQATTDLPPSPPPPPAPSNVPETDNALSGVRKALSDLWAHRLYLILAILIGAPGYLFLEAQHEPASRYVDPIVQPTAENVITTAPTPIQPATVLQGAPPSMPVPVYAPPPAVEVEPTASELVPINDETAAALGVLPPTTAPAPPTPTLHRRPFLQSVQKP